MEGWLARHPACGLSSFGLERGGSLWTTKAKEGCAVFQSEDDFLLPRPGSGADTLGQVTPLRMGGATSPKQRTFPDERRSTDTKEGFLMKRSFVILAAGCLAACGSSNNPGGVNAPPLTNFTFNSPAPVQAGSQQAQTASNAQSNVSATITAGQTSNVADASSEPMELTDIGVSALLAVSAKAPHDPSAQLGKKFATAQRSGQLDETCEVISSDGTSLTYNHCSFDDGAGDTITANGSLTATSSSITWDITFTITDTSQGDTLNFIGQWNGTIDFTATTISGSCTGAESVTETANGQTFNYAFTVGLDFLALTYDANCDGYFTGGQLEIREDVTASGGFTPPNPQAAIEFTWSGCDNVQVATSN